MDELDVDVVYSLIHNVLSRHAENANWKMILSLISTFVKKKSHHSHILKCIYLFECFLWYYFY